MADDGGCGDVCRKMRNSCMHKCQELCHPEKQCPDTLCIAEIRVYCKCGNKWENVVCESNPNKPPIECD